MKFPIGIKELPVKKITCLKFQKEIFLSHIISVGFLEKSYRIFNIFFRKIISPMVIMIFKGNAWWETLKTSFYILSIQLFIISYNWLFTKLHHKKCHIGIGIIIRINVICISLAIKSQKTNPVIHIMWYGYITTMLVD